MFKRIIALCIAVVLLYPYAIKAQDRELSCQSALLMDMESGKVLYKLNPHERLAPASVTKIMTMLIVMEEIYNGNLNYTDMVTASAYAKSMGGSTIFLDEGEIMSVDDLLKGIAVSSGNDACVAIAEHISGTCSEFVKRMNNKAKELGMTNTNFVNCNGLDADGHYSSAYDIALMSRELMKYEDIFKYTTIWMDSLRNGAFVLSNTNKLIRFYDGSTGLKTGSTSKAGFCISATAKRDNLHLIAVIMNAPTSKERQADASSILNYGFSAYSAQYPIKQNSTVPDAPVEKGTKDYVRLSCTDGVRILYEKSSEPDTEIKYEINKIKAPVTKGDIVGTAICMMNGETVGKTDIIALENIDQVNFTYSYGKIIDIWLGNK